MLKCTRIVCMTLMAMLFSWNVNAQEFLSKKSQDTPVLRAANQMNYSPAANCNPVQDLSYVVNGNTVSLTWNEPRTPIETGWITYSGENADAIGFSGTPTSVHVAARWTPGDLVDVAGATLDKARFFVYVSPSDYTHTIKIYQGGSGSNPGTLITSQDIPSDATPEAWYEATLNNPVTVDVTKELWIVVSINAPAGIYAAACDNGPGVQGFSDLISSNGTSFSSLCESNPDLCVNFNIAGHLVDAKGNPVILSRSTAISVTGYEVYRDNELLETVVETSFEETDLGEGDYRYCVKAVYDNGCVSDQICATAPVVECLVVENLVGEQITVGQKRVRLTWDAPAYPPEYWLDWSSATYDNALTFGDGRLIRTGVLWEPADLDQFIDDNTLTNIAVSEIRFIPGVETSTYTLIIREGMTGATLYTSETMDGKDLNIREINRVKLSEPITLDLSKDFFIELAATPSAGYPQTCDAGPIAAEGKSNLVYNGSWMQITQVSGGESLRVNWTIGARMIDPATGKSVDLGRLKSVNSPVTKYKIYRDGSFLREVTSGTTTYNDNNVPELDRTYTYGVTALTASCESLPVVVEVEVKDIVSIGDNDLDAVKIYPNPATSMVNIAGENITKVEVYNTVGQLMTVKTADFNTVDVSTFSNGIYIFKVYSGEDFSTKRIMIAR